MQDVECILLMQDVIHFNCRALVASVPFFNNADPYFVSEVPCFFVCLRFLLQQCRLLFCVRGTLLPCFYNLLQFIVNHIWIWLYPNSQYCSSNQSHPYIPRWSAGSNMKSSSQVSLFQQIIGTLQFESGKGWYNAPHTFFWGHLLLGPSDLKNQNVTNGTVIYRFELSVRPETQESLEYLWGFSTSTDWANLMKFFWGADIAMHWV